MNSLLRPAIALGIVSLGSGCNTIDRFDTKDGEAYCGNIVSAAFVRDGFPPDLRLRLTLDTDKLSTVPGTITTDDGQSGPCTPQPRLQAAELHVTEAMLHDQLSTFDFGTGRDYNFMAWVDSSCEGPMLAVVSLLKNDDVEVRLMKPPQVPTTVTTEPPAPGFALFQLTRKKGDCGF
ncbi:MAG: hypothetical protein IPI67_07580 [Myxococcales bacterium]|nr:hypothetical protein [Myxococcales bacterium]